MINMKRRGYFEITYENFEENLNDLYEAFKGIRFIPVRIDYDYPISAVRLLGTSPEFEEVGEGCDATQYTIITNHVGDKTTYGVMK